MEASAMIATMTGWNAEAFARTKTLKPLAKYLAPPEETKGGPDDVRAMISRMMKRQGGDDGR